MGTAAMAIKAAIAKAAFTILPFSIETELRLKYFMYTILIEVWGLSFVVSLAVYSSKPLPTQTSKTDQFIINYCNIYLSQFQRHVYNNDIPIRNFTFIIQD